MSKEEQVPEAGHNSLDEEAAVKYIRIMADVRALRKQANGLAREARELLSDGGWEKGACNDRLNVAIKKPHEKDGYAESASRFDKVVEKLRKDEPGLLVLMQKDESPTKEAA